MWYQTCDISFIRMSRYFYSLPYLLWRTPFPTWLRYDSWLWNRILCSITTNASSLIMPKVVFACRLVLFVMVELCWNVYPSNAYSSILLLGAHLIILGGLWMGPLEYPYSDDTNGRSANIQKKAGWRL